MLSSWFRRAVLWCCRQLGASGNPFTRTLLLNAVWLVLIAALVWLAASARIPPNLDAPRQLDSWLGPTRSWATWWTVASIWAFGLVVAAVIDARKRLVLTAFTDGSSGEIGLNVAGFSTLVATEIASLGDLFSEFQGGRPLQAGPDPLAPIRATLQVTPETLKPLNATFVTDAPDTLVERAVTSDTSFSLGPFKVPVGFILSIVGRIVQGPRVNGQVYRDGDSRVVTLRVLRPEGERYLSLVDSPRRIDGSNVTWRPARELAHDLACLFFAEVAMQGTVTGRALASFAEGVRAYRESILAPESRDLQSKLAERRLIDTIAEDPSFDLAHYNLGVVYTNSSRLDAAAGAFNRALAANNTRWSAYHALAVNSYSRAQEAFKNGSDDAGRGHLSTAYDYCNRALALATGAGVRAEIQSLQATVLWWRGWRVWLGVPVAQYREFRAAGKASRRAARGGWWALCRAELRGARTGSRAFERDRARVLASRHLQAFAELMAHSAQLLKLARDATATRGSDQKRLEEARRDLVAVRGARGWRAIIARALFRLAIGSFRLSVAANKLATSLRSNAWLRPIALRSAARSLRDALTLTPGAAKASLDLGVICLELGRDRQAVKSLELAASLAPGTADAWGFLARALLRRGEATRASEAVHRVFENLHAASPDTLAALAEAMDYQQQLLQDVRSLLADIAAYRSASGRWARARLTARFARLSYRLADRQFQQLAMGTAKLQEYRADPKTIDATSESIRRLRDRVTGHAVLLEAVAAERKKAAEGIERLKELLAEKRAAGYHWEVGYIGLTLCRVLEDAGGRLEEAEACVKETTTYLERTLPGEVLRTGLYAVWSRVLRRRGQFAAALEKARIAVLKDPVSAFERIELGYVHSALAEYGAAQEAFEIAARLRPDDPQPHLELVNIHLKQLDDDTSKADRRARVESASRHLNIALDLLPPADSRRNVAQFMLARVHSFAGRHADAVRELRALERRDYYDLAIEIYLADAYLARKQWVDAEREFRRVAAEVVKQIAAAPEGVNAIVPCPLDEVMVLGSVAAFACLGIAATLVDREVDLDQARKEVTLAREFVGKVENQSLQESWRASCDFWEGIVLLKQDRVEEAIKHLEATLRGKGDAGSYHQLANALTRKAELGDEAGRVTLLRRSVRYHREAQNLDWSDDLAASLVSGLARAESLAPAGVKLE